nr:HAD hydrolase-like protein [Pedobacter panaciterrae]
MNTLNYFLFDYDGTLCHTHDTINNAIVETFKEYQLDIPGEAQRLQAIGSGSTIHDAIVAMHPTGKSLPLEQINSMVNSYRTIYTDIDALYTMLFEGATLLLSSLKAQGKTVVVLSNKGFQTVTNSIRFFDLEQYTDLLIADGSPVMKNLNMKPDPASYISVIKNHFIPEFSTFTHPQNEPTNR